MLKRFLLAFLVAATSLGAARYVDSGCTNNGNGTAIDCAASAGAAGPWKTMEDARNGWACSDTVNIRGIHASHGSNHSAGLTDGRYSTNDLIRVSNAGCTSGTPLIIQASGYPSAPETVYIDGTGDPGPWTVCTWSSGVCQAPCGGLATQAICEGTWHVNAPGPMNLSLGAQKPNGAPTPRQLVLSDIDEQYESYSPWTGGGELFVYWGTGADAPGGANNPKPFVFFDNNGFGFYFCNNGFCSPWAQFVTIQGITIRCTRAAAIVAQGEDNTIRDVKILYSSGNNTGDDYGIAASTGFANRWTIDHVEVAYTGSEAIHFQAHCATSDCVGAGNPCLCCTGAGTGPTCGATVLKVLNSHIHDTGDTTTLGPAIASTPSGIIVGNHGSGASGNGNFAGSEIRGNLIRRTNAGQSCGRGIILENVTSNLIVRDNIFQLTYGPAVKMEATASGTGVNLNQVYNNLFLNANFGGGCGEGPGVIFMTSGGGTGTLDGNLIFNNTFIDPGTYAITESCNSKCTNTLMKNNIFYGLAGQKMVQWTNADASNKLEYNDYFTTANPAITWRNVPFSKSQIVAGCSGTCANSITDNPLFWAANDFHLQIVSPTIDTGTTDGLPAGRTIGLINYIDVENGFPDYNAWCGKCAISPDIGADEFNQYDILYGGTPPTPPEGTSKAPVCVAPPPF